MGFFRKQEPLHERLAREAGLDFPRDVNEVVQPGGAMSPDHPFWQVAGIHGVPRPREWQAVSSAEAPGLPGDQVSFVALEDGSLIVDEEVPDDSLVPLADALEGSIEAPYRGVARRSEGDMWTVGAARVDVVDVPEDIIGDEVDIAFQDGELAVMIDGGEADGEITSLQAFAAARFEEYVLHASRLDDALWEVTVLPL